MPAPPDPPHSLDRAEGGASNDEAGHQHPTAEAAEEGKEDPKMAVAAKAPPFKKGWKKAMDREWDQKRASMTEEDMIR